MGAGDCLRSRIVLLVGSRMARGRADQPMAQVCAPANRTGLPAPPVWQSHQAIFTPPGDVAMASVECLQDFPRQRRRERIGSVSQSMEPIDEIVAIVHYCAILIPARLPRRVVNELGFKC